MKIAHVVCTFPPYHGGIGNVAYNSAKNLGKLGLGVTVFAPNYNKQDISFVEFKYEALNPLLKYGNGAFLPQLFWRLKNFDIVHLHYPFFGGVEPVWFRKIFSGKRIKLFVHYHMDIAELSPIARLLSGPDKLIRHSLFDLADIITCASLDYIQESQIKDIFSRCKSKFCELPFGVDTEKFKPNSNWQLKKDKILFVGALDKAHNFKGLEVLMSAIAKIDDKKLKLIVVGGGNLLDYYKKLAQNLGITARVEFIGTVDDDSLPNYYRNADLLVLPSINKHEAFGLVLLEAMASGIPVIASDLPGVRKVFNDGAEGLLAKTGDAYDVAEKIKKILYNNEKWSEMCQAARSLAVDKYSWEKIARQLNDLYQYNLKLNS